MIWLDNHLSPALAAWIEAEFAVPCVQIRELGLERAQDREIFTAAKRAAQVFVTKDRDFVDLVRRLMPPPCVVLLSCGNTGTAYVRTVLRGQLEQALRLAAEGEPLIEIG